MEEIRATPVEELRKRHPDQATIDTATADLLRATASPTILPPPGHGLAKQALTQAPPPVEDGSRAPL